MSDRVLYNAGKVGRVFTLTKKDVETISKNFSRTLVLSTVAGLSQRHEQTIKAWLKQGEEDYFNGTDTLFKELYTKVKTAISNRIAYLEKSIEDNKSGWQRFAWLLERTARKDYSQFGEILDELEAKIADISQKITSKNSTAKEIAKETKEWIKAKIKEKKEDAR